MPRTASQRVSARFFAAADRERLSSMNKHLTHAQARALIEDKLNLTPQSGFGFSLE